MSKKDSQVNVHVKNVLKNAQTVPSKLNAFRHLIVSEHLSKLLGEVLTIVDASVEESRSKAVKDLVRQTFDRKQQYFTQLALNPKYESIWSNQLIEYVIERDSSGNDYIIPVLNQSNIVGIK